MSFSCVHVYQGSYQGGRRADTQSTPKPADINSYCPHGQSDKETTEKGLKNPEQLEKVSIFSAFSITSRGQEMKPVGISFEISKRQWFLT